MTLPTESVTLAGSGLTFINSYDASVSSAYRGSIITAEHELQSHFTNQVTISVDFSLASLSPGAAASNSFSELGVSYSTLKSALLSHATSTDDSLAVNGLPTTDPSAGAGFALALPQARILGLLPQTNATDLHVTLNSNLAWSFGQDAVGAIEHELSEGGFGRFASLGFDGTRWMPLDLFRFTAAGVRDYTGGSDGVTTYFGLNSAHVSSLAYHNAVNASGVFDGGDLGDWGSTFGDAFGPGGPGGPGSLSATDLQVLDVLGWNTAPFTPAADDYAGSLADTDHSFGAIAVGGTATGTLQQAGDHDWFRVTLQAGATYTITETGQHGSGGTLGDPYLALHDASGAQVAFNDDATSGSNPDSSLISTAGASGTYYIDAGAFVDGYAGSYTLGVTQSAAPTSPPPVSPPPVSPPPILSPPPPPVSPPPPPGVSISAPAGATLSGGAGDDTLSGGTGADTFHGSAGAGYDVVTDFNYAEGDRVQLDAGTSYHLIQAGPDLVIDMGAGVEMVLKNTQLSSLGSDWLFTG
jgi:hypothetical protein